MTDDQALERLLDETHAALLQGRLADLPDLASRTEACLAGLDPAGGLLPRLRLKAERNARCLQAAGRGLRAAHQRLADLRAAGQGHSTYDGQGRRQGLAVPSSLSHRL
jgi:hypothetical protein